MASHKILNINIDNNRLLISLSGNKDLNLYFDVNLNQDNNQNCDSNINNESFTKLLLEIADEIVNENYKLEDKKTSSQITDKTMFEAYCFIYDLFLEFENEFNNTRNKETEKLQNENRDLKEQIKNNLG